ncbi:MULTISPECIES: electron transport complex subunit RsxC [unclassified Lentimicrobium]|uniref:electron transport complex subunit RsxC n=1 Tax=unclassified Lentimicrobium TaxID=2677434 RepID=UPI0015569754|nr:MULTISPECIES: electron transport complex subunit RsxC [unclassified Lentimicrobium]NPD45151.1 electron transport complex subunit RsxC [Lentimicrobium sp. S6]NPD84515.1 electron transport complex subunit RsxC [Lentimicrobium sp. L6]
MKTFKLGGVHPPENKLSAQAAIEYLPLPKQVTVPIGQHLGAPATPVVKKGDEIKVGQLLAKASGFISANIHSPVSGKVFKIDDVYDSSGYRKPSIIINVEGDEWLENIDQSKDIVKDIKLSNKEIVDKINEMGVVGLGGATFPSFVKLMVPEGKKVEFLVINGVECEPYLTSDHRLMLERGEEMMIGISILMKGLNVDKALIGVENNKPDAIEELKRLAKNFKGIEIHPLKVQYPQGGEKQLIQAITGKEVPSGKLPLEVGCVVNNVGTALAVYEAIQKNKPLIERVVTVTGKSVKKPSNFMVRIGTPVKELIEAAEGLPEDTGKIINGGPMMGKALLNTDVPVVKGTSGILIMPENESKRGETSNCIRCAKCVQVCPMGLEPVYLSKTSKLQMFDKVENERVMDCIECGSCSYTCPANIPLLDFIRFGKNKVGGIIRNRNKK